jgi:hypothetical protein
LNRLTALLIIFFHAEVLLFSQVKIPDQPFVPEIKTDTNRPINKFTVKVVIHGMGNVDGDMVLDTDVLITHDSNVPQIKIIDLSKINILLWEKRSRKKVHIFYPVKYELTFRDSSKITVTKNIVSINRIKVRINNRFKYFYLFYYDYFKKGKWINSGFTEFKSQFSKPVNGCVTSIEVIQ